MLLRSRTSRCLLHANNTKTYLIRNHFAAINIDIINTALHATLRSEKSRNAHPVDLNTSKLGIGHGVERDILQLLIRLAGDSTGSWIGAVFWAALGKTLSPSKKSGSQRAAYLAR